MCITGSSREGHVPRQAIRRPSRVWSHKKGRCCWRHEWTSNKSISKDLPEREIYRFFALSNRYRTRRLQYIPHVQLLEATSPLFVQNFNNMNVRANAGWRGISKATSPRASSSSKSRPIHRLTRLWRGSRVLFEWIRLATVLPWIQWRLVTSKHGKV